MIKVEESRFYKDVVKSKKTITQLQDLLNKIKTHLEAGEREIAYQLSMEYIKLSERLVSEARLMPISTGYVNALDDVKDVIIKENKVLVKYLENDIFYLKIPALLTKKEAGNPSYIRATVKYALDDYFENNYRRIIDDKVVIVIKHNYSKERSYRQYRDHDNIEVNAIIDLIALYVLIDDSSYRCDHYYLSDQSLEDNTEIFIVPKGISYEFISNFKNNKGSDQ